MVRSLAFFLAAWLLLALALVAWVAVASPAGAEGETPVIVTNWPTPGPYPTMPIRCATPPVWSPESGPVCGIPAVAVAHVNGEGGYQMAIFFAIIGGFGFVGACVLAGLVVKK